MWVHRLSNIDPVNSLADCSTCGTSISIFKRPSGRVTCSGSVRTSGKNWRLNHRAHVSSQWQRYNLLRRYSLSEEKYSELLDSQGGCCAICLTPATKFKKRLHVDHDHNCCPSGHSCGKCIRGLLCPICNRFLAYVESDLRLKAMAYLEKYLDQRTKQPETTDLAIT